MTITLVNIPHLIYRIKKKKNLNGINDIFG